MSRRMILRALATVVVGATLVAPSLVRAQEGGPAAIFTAKSAGEVIGDLRYLVSAVAPADDPRTASVLQALDGLKDPAALKGIDPSRPLGAFGSLGDAANPTPSAVVFIPVLDGKGFLAALEGFGATVDANAGAPGFSHKVTLPVPNVPPLFVVDAGKYLFFSMAPTGADALKTMKPETLLPRRPGAGDISLTLRLDRLPQQIKDAFNNGLEQNLAAQRERLPNEDDAAFKARMTGMQLSQDAFVALVRDGKELALDVVIDPKTEFVGLELNSSAVAGTPYASALQKMSVMKSKFRALTANSAMGGFVAMPMAKGIRDILNQAVEKGKAEGLEKAKDDPAHQKLFADMVEAVRPTLTAETLDLAMSIQGPFPATAGADSSYVVVSAMSVKGGKKIEATLLEGLKTAPADKKKNIKINAAKAADGTSIHKITGLNDGKDAAPFGEDTLYAAFRDDVVVIAVGKNGQTVLNQALTSSKTPAAGPAPQLEVFMAASKIAGISPKEEDRKAWKEAAAKVFAGQTAKKDKFGVILKVEGGNLSFRLGGDVLALKFFSLVGQSRAGAAQ
ncbi:MAG: hypothetical protein JWN86_4314 [Planctomycetota bacterium]|nr:hypothetical protein [Planctomycetota bacterium]